MKVRNYLTLMVLATHAVAVSAETKGKWEEGFSGTAMLLFGVTQSNSQADSGNDVIHSLDEKGETKTESFIYPVASSHLNYTLHGGDQQLFLGTSNADIALGRPHFEVGYGQYVHQVGTFRLSYIPGLLSSTTWEDPFLVGSKREETDRRIQGVRLQYNEILDTRLGLEFAAGKNKLDDEMSASQYSPDVQSKLKREGDLYYTEVSYITPLSPRLLLRSSVSYLRNNAQGDAMSSNTYAGQIGILKRFESALLTMNFTYKYSSFDGQHPIFMKKREDDVVSLLATYVYDDIFGWDGVGVAVMGGFTKEMSNLDFYQSDNVILGTGVRYVF